MSDELKKTLDHFWPARPERFSAQHLRGCAAAYATAMVSAERDRCAAIVRRFRLDEHADIMLREIENG